MSTPRFFPTSAQLQEFLLKEAGPGTLVVVPHQRLAHQVWHRQRLCELEQGRPAWEPLPLVTLQGWFNDLFQSLWPPEALASPLTRLAWWRQALVAGPALPGTAPDLKWAQALDEAHILLKRHLLPVIESGPDDPPVVGWRRQITQIYTQRLTEGGWITPGDLPAYLLKALNSGKIALPPKVLVVGFQTPAPAEEAWFQKLSLVTEVIHLQVQGDPQAVREAVVLPDCRQEMEWVAAKLAELAYHDGIPLHRLAVTSPDMDNYAPQFRRVLGELWGPPQSGSGWAYNFSQGPCLMETPVFQAALLPLKFATSGERREDLVSFLLSPYCGLVQAHQGQLPLWDRLWRDLRAEQGWDRFRKLAAQNAALAPAAAELLPQLEQVWDLLKGPAATGREWAARLKAAWQRLAFPVGLDEAETGTWTSLLDLIQELETSLASETLGGGDFLDWLTQGARDLLLPGPGVQEAGIQIMGLLEIRGLDFSRILCLGMNSGVLPAPPRPLPLLSTAEKRQVLGGTYQSQQLFARELFQALLGAAPQIILTRPLVADQEERVATPLYLGEWQKREMAPLSRPHPAWLKVPGIKAAFTIPKADDISAEAEESVSIALPEAISISRAQTALGCPCRFLLEVLLGIKELPEIESGLDPRERGDRLHQVLARFAQEFKKILDEEDWYQPRAREMLEAAARHILQAFLSDLHWQAEWERWLGEGEASPGLLWEWLEKEKERYDQGWRWEGTEVTFQGLTGPDWPFSLKGRIDRIDYHPAQGDLILWDYKSGEVPKVKKVFEYREEFQLPGYLLAVKKGRVPLSCQPSGLRAGFIGLKSPREKHLKYEDFDKRAGEWDQVLLAWEERLAALGRRFKAGDFSPSPTPAPEGQRPGACEYCPYSLVCGFYPEQVSEEGEDEE